jgi:hypothetical protein
MKKFLLIIVLLWAGFLCYTIFKEKVRGFLSNEEKESLETVEQVPEKSAPKSEPVSKVEDVSPTVSERSQPMEEESVVPFEPLPQKKLSKADQEQSEGEIVKNKLPDPRSMVVADYNKDPFGLVCTKFSRLPSRFRLVSWEGLKKVILEDLENFDHGTKSYPRYSFELNVPYKELKHAVTGKSRFMICKSNDANKRLQLLSFNVKHEALSFSAAKKPIGYLVVRDFKLGGHPYQITNEMEEPLTSSYALEFEQFKGPQKFSYDLTGKPKNYTFGSWGYEYKLISYNFTERSLVVQRKELRTGRILRKEILAQP